MDITDLIPGLEHVAFVAQCLGKLIQRFAVSVAELVDGGALFIRIRRLGRGFLVFTGFVQ